MTSRKLWRFVRKPLLYGIALLILLLSAGFMYQQAGSRNDQSQYKPVGKLVDVFGRKMHIYSGGEGNSTVIFNAGWGTVNPYVDFYPLYDKIAGQVRFAVIDNFGYGYSDLTDCKRDIDLIVEEMHAGLELSGEKPPYIMVGHSLSSLTSIRFTQKYPDEVKGIVLLDGGSPELYANQPPLTVISHFQRFLINFGVARGLYHFNGFAESVASERNGLKLLPDDLKGLDRLSTLLIGNNPNMTDEMRQSQNNAKKVLQGKKPLHVPLTSITAGSFGKVDANWLDSQNGKQMLVEDAGHYVHHYRPDLVAEEILKMR